MKIIEKLKSSNNIDKQMKVVKEETNGACKCPERDEEYNDECDDNEV